MEARLILLYVMAHLMVGEIIVNLDSLLVYATHILYIIHILFPVHISVTGLHDMDEFVQSQLILAVSIIIIVC